jgi:hypothetical protein
MDFKNLINKLDSIEAPQQTPAAPTLPKAVQLNEDAELRVLAGTSSILEEAKKMKKDKKEKMEEVTAPADKKKSDEPVKEAAKKKVKDPMKKEALEPEFKSKFMKMVEAKKKEKEDKKKKMEEAKKPDEDNDGVPDWADKKPGKADKKPGKNDDTGKKKNTKGLSAKQKKLPPGLQKAIAKKKGTAESVETNKKVVAESVEPKMSFREMMKLVVESGGQQQIDPLDKALFTWATRMAQHKLGEGMKAEVYAGLVYERMGGRFEMYDVLSENQK